MRILVTGSKGQLGFDVINELERRGHTPIGVDIDEMDITDAAAVERVITQSDVEAIIHCAAYTAVDAAEDNEELCRRINVKGTEHIAKMCKELRLKMMYVSTDYVFDGQGEHFWEPDDIRKPLNTYGQTKYEGELAVEQMTDAFFIVRIAWVFGLNGKNFVDTMLRLGESQKELNVVNDQIGSPTYTYDLAKVLVDMIETKRYGRYHVTNEGLCSWYDFAVEIFRQAGMNVKVNPVDSSQFPVKAKRPANSRMSKEKLDSAGFGRMPAWQDALARYLKALGR